MLVRLAPSFIWLAVACAADSTWLHAVTMLPVSLVQLHVVK
jgi:hypothetical protein